MKWGAVTPVEALHYAMSLPAGTTISGMDTLVVLQQNLDIFRAFQPLTSTAMQELRDCCKTYAADGRSEFFKTTVKYDGNIGREQHRMPSAKELPV